MSRDAEVIQSLHEAGHAVVAHVLGGRIQTVELSALTRAAGCPLAGENLATAAVAGGVAARLFGPRVRSMNRNPSRSDLAVAAQALGIAKLGPFETSQLEARAEKILVQQSGPVRRIAEALRTTGALSGAQVAALMTGSPVERGSAPAAGAPAPDAAPALCTFMHVEGGGYDHWLAYGSSLSGEDITASGSTRDAAHAAFRRKLAS